MTRASVLNRGVVVVAVLAAVAALIPVTVLELENEKQQRRFQFRLETGESFSVTYHHSMYDQPVTEEFAVGDDGRIVLKSLSSPSAAVREYFGIYAPGATHRMNRIMPQIAFRIAAGVPQRLRLRERELSFLDFGDHGERLIMRSMREPVAVYVLQYLRDVLGTSLSTGTRKENT